MLVYDLLCRSDVLISEMGEHYMHARTVQDKGHTQSSRIK